MNRRRNSGWRAVVMLVTMMLVAMLGTTVALGDDLHVTFQLNYYDRTISGGSPDTRSQSATYIDGNYECADIWLLTNDNCSLKRDNYIIGIWYLENYQKELSPGQYVTFSCEKQTMACTGILNFAAYWNGDLSNATIEFESTSASAEYTGAAQSPAFTVKYYGTELTANTDYTFTWVNNTDVGKATLTITGTGTSQIGNDYTYYTGTKKADFTITPKEVTVSGTPTVKEKSYDGTKEMVVDNLADLSLPEVVKSDEVTLTATAEAADEKPGENKDVTVTYGLSGEKAANYKLASTSTTATCKGKITQREVTVSGTPAVKEKSYDGTKGMVVDNLADLSLDGVLKGDEVTLTATAEAADANSGENKDVIVTYGLSGEKAANYKLASTSTTVTCKGKITQREVTVSGTPTVKEKSYDGTKEMEVDNLTDLSLPEVVKGEDVTLTATAEAADANPGENKVVTVTYGLSGEKAANYKLASTSTTVTCKGKITQREVTVSGTPTVKEKSYDGTKEMAVDNLADLSLPEVVKSDEVTLTATAEAADANPGDKEVTVTYGLSGEKAANYKLASTSTTVTCKGKITQREVTVSGTPTVKEKSYDGTKEMEVDNLTALSLPEVLTGEDVTLTATAEAADANPGENKDVTVTYGLSGEKAANYKLASTSTTATCKGKITQKEVTVSGTPTVKEKSYDGTKKMVVDNVESLILGGYESTDEGKVTLTATAEAADANPGENKDVTVTYGLSGEKAANYKLASTSTTATCKGKITQREVTVSGTPTVKEKSYDGTKEMVVDNLADLSLPEVVEGEEVTLTATAEAADANPGDKEVTVTYGLSGEKAANYKLASTSTSATCKGKITPKNIGDRDVKVVFDGSADQVWPGTTFPKFTLEMENGTKLAVDTDYTRDDPEPSAITDVGSYDITLTAVESSAYTGTKTVSYKVLYDITVPADQETAPCTYVPAASAEPAGARFEYLITKAEPFEGCTVDTPEAVDGGFKIKDGWAGKLTYTVKAYKYGVNYGVAENNVLWVYNKLTEVVEAEKGETYAGITWANPDDAVQGYKVYLDGSAYETVTVNPGKGKTASCTFTQLEAGSTHSLTIVSIYPYGEGNKKFTSYEGGSFTTMPIGTSEEILVESFKVNVSGKKNLSGKTLKLEVGKQRKITISAVKPRNATNLKLRYRSSNPSVCTVKNGLLVAKKAGVTTITVTARDGSGTKVSFKVKVVK